MLSRKTKKINSNYKSISVLENVIIGGLNQSILIRGENVNNPLMLFLHGGPGTAQIGFAPKFQSNLEKNFTVINWDQRGAGLSYDKNIRREELTIENMVTDTVELVKYLLGRFNQEKIFLVGHSWGTVLGLLTVKNAPDLIHAYIGIGQVVNMKDGEKISYDYTLNKANDLKNKKALKELSKVEFNPNDLKYLDIQRKWLTKFGGSFIGVTMYNLIYSNMLFATEYTIKDWMSYMKAGKFSLDALWQELMEVNFLETISELEVPVWFLVGKYDYQTPFQLVERYFNTLECPKKELVWFENSGHLLNYEETDKFNEVCLKIKEFCI